MPEETEEKTIPEGSILDAVKKDLGASEWDDAFDSTLIRDINTVFMILNQLGVGPVMAFRITGYNETWDDFETMGADIEGVKSYLYKRVKLMFDPSTSSFVNESEKALCDELEWRLNVASDTY